MQFNRRDCESALVNVRARPLAATRSELAMDRIQKKHGLKTKKFRQEKTAENAESLFSPVKKKI
jgi:hypothetical protein